MFSVAPTPVRIQFTVWSRRKKVTICWIGRITIIDTRTRMRRPTYRVIDTKSSLGYEIHVGLCGSLKSLPREKNRFGLFEISSAICDVNIFKPRRRMVGAGQGLFSFQRHQRKRRCLECSCEHVTTVYTSFSQSRSIIGLPTCYQ